MLVLSIFILGISIAFNKYPSWYGHASTIAQDFATVKQLVDSNRGDLGLLITEYGAGGCPSQHVVNDENYFNNTIETSFGHDDLGNYFDFLLIEERRIFYVAITRAKKRLYLTVSKKYKYKAEHNKIFDIVNEEDYANILT